MSLAVVHSYIMYLRFLSNSLVTFFFSIENKAGFTLSYLGDFELEFLSDAVSLGFGKLLVSDRIKFAL